MGKLSFHLEIRYFVVLHRAASICWSVKPSAKCSISDKKTDFPSPHPPPTPIRGGPVIFPFPGKFFILPSWLPVCQIGEDGGGGERDLFYDWWGKVKANWTWHLLHRRRFLNIVKGQCHESFDTICDHKLHLFPIWTAKMVLRKFA